MSKPRAVLEAMEATLEGGKEPAHASFVELGMASDSEPEQFEPPPGWDIGDRALFHYVRGNYGLYRLSDSYLNKGITDFGEAFNALVAAKDAARATRAFARLLRECAYASFSLPNAFEAASAMLGKLDWMRANAPRRDVEELDLSLVEMLTRMARESPFNDRNSLVRAYALVRATLTRLFDQPLTRQRALPQAIAGFWLGFDALWTDDDLAEPRAWVGDDGASAGREELRRAAYHKACELEDGSFYRVGAATPTKERRLRDLAKHFAHLLTQYTTLRDPAGRDVAIARWGKELGEPAVAAALEQAARDATPPADDAAASDTTAAEEPTGDAPDADTNAPVAARARIKRPIKVRASTPAAKPAVVAKPAPAAKKAPAKASARTASAAVKPGAKASAKTTTRAAKPAAKASAKTTKPAAKKAAAPAHKARAKKR